MAGTVRMWKIDRDSCSEDYDALQAIIDGWDKESPLDIVWSDDLELVTYAGDGKRVNPEVVQPCCNNCCPPANNCKDVGSLEVLSGVR